MSWFVKQIISLFLLLYLLFISGCTPAPLNRQIPYQSPLASPLTRQTPRQLQLTSSAWESIPLPTTDQHLLSSTISSNDPAVVYACTSTSGVPGVVGSLALWRTHDAGQHWFALSFPPTSGAACSISLAPALSLRVTVLVSNVCSNRSSCSQRTLYVSADSGDHWQSRALASILPSGITIHQSETLVTAAHLYLWCAYRTALNGPDRSLLARSDDDGISWSRIDTNLTAPDSFFLPPKIDLHETLLISVQSLLSSDLAPGSSLWISRNFGIIWQKLSAAPFPADNFWFTSELADSSLPTNQTPFYALRAEQIPSNLYALTVLQSTNAQQWSLLPPLPVSGTSAQHPGLLQVLAVTGSGDLLAFGPDPKVGLTASLKSLSDPTPAFWLWFWNPRASTWQVLSTPLAHPLHESCGHCWSATISRGPDHATYLYVDHLDESNSLFRMCLPSLLLRTN